MDAMSPDELKRWREAHGLTLRRLATLLDVHYMTIWRWEHEQRQPPHWLRFALPQIEQQLKQENGPCHE